MARTLDQVVAEQLGQLTLTIARLQVQLDQANETIGSLQAELAIKRATPLPSAPKD